MTKLPGLDPTQVDIDSPVYLAQRYLASAYDSVSSLIETTYPVLRAEREASRGRLTHAEQDVFRAAVVFSGAGVDSVLKQALRSCVPLQTRTFEGARDKYIEFVVRYIKDGSSIDARRLALLMTSSAPAELLLDEYVGSLTGSSLQSQAQVTATLSALGLQNETQLFKDAKKLNPLFKVRNQIAHEMDMTEAAVKGRGKRTRHERSLTTYVDMCHAGLNYCQRVLNTLEADCRARRGGDRGRRGRVSVQRLGDEAGRHSDSRHGRSSVR